MSELPKAYIAKDHESHIYDLWQKNQAFKPTGTGEPFSILMPPPNANESLHVGQALMVSVEDLMIRFARMSGKQTLWIPGTDHAGFETQVVYEKKLQKEGKSRFDFSSDELRENIRSYVEEQKNTIISQFRMLGASCDWDKLYFTLDEQIVDTVYQTFRRMHQDDLLYRAKRLVNYCVKHGTSFSDLEVEYEEREGQLVYIKYPLSSDPKQHITVATTRPETMLGDVAVAVHPEDKRYKALIGLTAIVPLVNREVPIIADKRVEQAFGSGAVKITPSHSVIDGQIGSDHHLGTIEVIDTHGKMKGDIPADLQGLKVAAARAEIVAKLHELELIDHIVTLGHRVGVCYKCKTPIEILPLDQWWIRTKPLAETALQALRDKKITITPKESRRNLVAWLENIIDWNISRQIVWGIPIPAWYKKSEAPNTKPETNSKDQIQKDSNFEFRISNLDEKNLEIKIQATSPGEGWVQDPDTFDTWFSSSQLPFATLGYPNSPDFQKFFPTKVMETGGDILNWWVARMIMMSLYATGEVPFKHIYLHGLVLDAEGKKMSKSKGNVVNPLEIMDQYGTDALRWGLIHGTSAGQNFRMTVDRVIGGRNLANKLWNASRYVLFSVEQKSENPSTKHEANSDFGFRISDLQDPTNKTIVAELQKTITQVTKCLDSNQYALASDLLHDFFWHQFCDVYLEQSKALLQDSDTAAETASALLLILTTTLKLFHPFMPFVTEALWQELHARKLVPEPLLITSKWPSAKT